MKSGSPTVHTCRAGRHDAANCTAGRLDCGLLTYELEHPSGRELELPRCFVAHHMELARDAATHVHAVAGGGDVERGPPAQAVGDLRYEETHSFQPT